MFEFTKPGKVLAAPRFESVQNAGGELQCPSCGFNYLHQGRVEVFERAEDAETGTRVVVDSGKVEVDDSMLGNPSPRRDGVRIHFWCEGCKSLPYMEIVQHKGNTYVGMGIAAAAQEEPNPIVKQPEFVHPLVRVAADRRITIMDGAHRLADQLQRQGACTVQDQETGALFTVMQYSDGSIRRT